MNCKSSHNLFVVFSLWLGIFFLGCIGPRGSAGTSPEAAGKQPFPTIAVRYFPYGPSLERAGLTPIPDYRGWTNERMERDICRMVNAGISLIVVRIDLGEFWQDKYQRERFERFVTMASSPRVSGSERVSVVFEVTQRGPGAERNLRHLLDWFVDKGIGSMQSYFQWHGRSLILLGAGTMNTTLRHPAIGFSTSGGQGSLWNWEASPLAVSRNTPLPSSARQLAVSAGKLEGTDARGRLTWSVPRRKGRTLRTALRAAFAQRPTLVLVSSWNDYEHGDFVEPNSLDGDRLLNTLKREIARLRARCAR